MQGMLHSANHSLTNRDIAELLATEAETAKPPFSKALRRASRRAFLWPGEASQIVSDGRSLEELPAVGPYLDKVIRRWIENFPVVPEIPNIRAAFFTLAEARALLRTKPSWLREIKGDLQMHTQWSDGSGTIAEMAQSAAQRGYEYIAITDHSKGLKIAGGINEEQLAVQGEDVLRVNDDLAAANVNVRVMHGIELNLNPAGQGDMDSDSLSRLDLVLGCFHSALRKKEDQTERYLAALRNPDIQILGHPRGRIYNFRMGLKADWARVFDLAAELDKAVEIDGYPDRQDLSTDLLSLARKAGCRISLGTDSHDPLQLRFMEFSLAGAIAAGIKRDRILNFMTADELLSWVENVHSKSR